MRLTNRFSILPSVYGRFLIGKEIPYSKLNAMGGDVPSRFLQQQLPFVGINNVELTLTGNYALSSHKVSGLLKEKTMFGCGVGYGLDSIFGPLEASINYANHADKVSMYVNLGFKF